MAAPARPTFARKALRFILGGAGISLIVSAVVNLVAAFQLIDAAEEQSLGITRNEIAASCSALLLMGVLLVFVAVRRGK